MTFCRSSARTWSGAPDPRATGQSPTVGTGDRLVERELRGDDLALLPDRGVKMFQPGSKVQSNGLPLRL